MAGLQTIGKLKRRIKFEQNDPVQNAGGPGESDVFTDLMTVWGSMEKLSGNRSLDAGDISQAGRYEIFVWYRQDLYEALLFGTSPRECRIVVDPGREFTIDNWEVVDDEQHQIRFIVNERR